eukprot:6379455-Amphidinium_carterae.1
MKELPEYVTLMGSVHAVAQKKLSNCGGEAGAKSLQQVNKAKADLQKHIKKAQAWKDAKVETWDGLQTLATTTLLTTKPKKLTDEIQTLTQAFLIPKALPPTPLISNRYNRNSTLQTETFLHIHQVRQRHSPGGIYQAKCVQEAWASYLETLTLTGADPEHEQEAEVKDGLFDAEALRLQALIFVQVQEQDSTSKRTALRGFMNDFRSHVGKSKDKLTMGDVFHGKVMEALKSVKA